MECHPVTIKELMKAYRAEPFQPFSLRLSDGGILPVPHSEFMAYAPEGRTCVVYATDGDYSIVDLRHVTAIEIRAGRDHDAA